MATMMVRFMPLKSVASFGGPGSAQKIQQLIEKMREAVNK
jgi:hypothetical protein